MNRLNFNINGNFIGFLCANNMMDGSKIQMNH